MSDRSRGERGAGDGSTQPVSVKLACGHRVKVLQEVAVKADGTRLYRCSEPSCGLQPKAWTQK